jgi:Retrotransposon gag protein
VITQIAHLTPQQLSSSAATSQSHSALVIDFCFSALHTSQTSASVSPFTRKDPKKLKAFIFQCQLYFHNLDFDSDSKVTFALSYLRDVAQEWFEPGISRLTNEPPEWFDNWEAFLDELRTNFGPYNKTGDAEHKLTSLCMRNNKTCF